MGGVFSGKRESRKRIVESCAVIDTAYLKRWRLLTNGTRNSGSLEWAQANGKKPAFWVGYTLEIAPESGTLSLRYQLESPAEAVEYQISLVTTKCHLGGLRWWLICPLSCNGVRCGCRVRKLYLCGKYFGCRRCHNLTYRSRQESDSRVYAAVRGGLDFANVDAAERMSVSQLGFALKVLNFALKRQNRRNRKSSQSPDEVGN